MSKAENPLESIKEIRNMMERSSRFISLSGLSGVFAGVYALVAAQAARMIINDYVNAIRYEREKYRFRDQELISYKALWDDLNLKLFVVAGITLALSLATGYLLTHRNARKAGLKTWDSTSKRMLLNLAIPLLAGGVFCIALIAQGNYGMVASSTLVFYGMALLNAGKYTLNDIRQLGICEIILGLVACFFPGDGLLFWALGFGVLHIVYGGMMWYKYERNR